MKIKFLITVVCIVWAELILAAGYHYTGSVWVVDSGSYQYMYGYYNNRWNSNPTTSPTNLRIRSSGTATYVSIYGIGGNREDGYFSCRISQGSSLYEDAIMLAHTLGDGAYISVRKPLNSDECNSLYVSRSSAYLH